MTSSDSMAQLFACFINPASAAASDYFGLIKKLVAQRNECRSGSAEHAAFQQKIDAVYELVLEEIRNNLGQPISAVKFGTSGWRGILGKDLFGKSVAQVTTAIIAIYEGLDSAAAAPKPELLAALGVASLKEAQARGCVVGYDNRIGGESLAGCAVDILTARGFKVYYAGEASTGTLSAALLQLNAAFSINLTPSHNPLEYGGYKYNAADGGPAAAILTDLITAKARAIIEQGGPLPAVTPDPALVTNIDALVQWQAMVKANQQRHGLDYDRIMADFARDAEVVAAVDCVHGASRLHIQGLFQNPATDRLLLLRAAADPTFGGIAPEPSSANLRPVAGALNNRPEPLKVGAIIDPDADRIRFTDGTTEISMNQFGAMAYHYLHEVKGKKGLVAKTVATSNFANAVATALHEEVFEPRVGFKEFKPVIGRALVCFEESDGISVIGHTPEKDAYIGLLLALDMVMTTRKNLGEYLAEIEAIYGRYFPAAASVVVSRQGRDLLDTLAGLAKYGEGSVIEVSGQPRRIKKIIDIDGRKMIMEDGGWIMIRPSGTEPKVRFYVEARTEQDKAALLEAARGMLAEIGLL